jgi:hypothetical protein
MSEEPTLPVEEEEFKLRPPEGPGRERIEKFLDDSPSPLAAMPVDPPVKSDFQFHLTDILIVTAGVGLGLAGGSWMPVDIFAAVLGLITLLALMLVHVYPPENRLGKVLWGTLVLAYLISVAAAIMRPALAE